jgi:hypothetical protein
MRLLVMPREPRPNPYAFFHSERLQPSWKPFMPWLDDGPATALGNGHGQANGQVHTLSGRMNGASVNGLAASAVAAGGG